MIKKNMKQLKNILMLMVALLATTAFAACGDDDNGAGGGTPVSKLTVRPAELFYPYGQVSRIG